MGLGFRNIAHGRRSCRVAARVSSTTIYTFDDPARGFIETGTATEDLGSPKAGMGKEADRGLLGEVLQLPLSSIQPVHSSPGPIRKIPHTNVSPQSPTVRSFRPLRAFSNVCFASRPRAAVARPRLTLDRRAFEYTSSRF